MNGIDLLKRLAEVRAATVLTMGPGPFRVRVGAPDGLAARLLLWLDEQLPAGATLGDAEDVLQAALWWTITLEQFQVGAETSVAPALAQLDFEGECERACPACRGQVAGYSNVRPATRWLPGKWMHAVGRAGTVLICDATELREARWREQNSG